MSPVRDPLYVEVEYEVMDFIERLIEAIENFYRRAGA